MTRSYLILFAALALTAAACSTNPPLSPSRAPHIYGTATLTITTGVPVTASVPLPPGFQPIAGRPPMWLQNGTEIGVVGTENSNVIVLGFSGPGWKNSRVLAAARGKDAAEQGRIVDLAASPNGITLASAVQVAGANRLDVVLRDLIASGAGQPVTSFDGTYSLASMQWLNDGTIAMELRPKPEPAPLPALDPNEAPPGELPPSSPPKPSEGLQLIVVTGPGSVAPLRLNCPISTIQWNPEGRYGVAAGDSVAPPAIIDRAHSTCTRLDSAPPVTVLSWSPSVNGEFLSVRPVPAAHSAGVFKYDIKTAATKLIAVSSGAAAYTQTGSILAYGSQKLRWKMIERQPLSVVTAEVATFPTDESRVDIKQLGFQTVPPMLLRSTMAYSRDTDRAAIVTYAPAVPVPMRKILIYSLGSENAFQIAYGPAKGITELGWSPGGRSLAIVDGDASRSTLTIVLPPG
jgi:hypothetical protein